MNQLTEIERAKLLKKRREVEIQLRALNDAPLGRSNAAATFRDIDLRNLAHKIVLIDRKLGRTE